jgi:hypothetical protein
METEKTWDGHHFLALIYATQGDKYQRRGLDGLAKTHYQNAAEREVAALESMDQSNGQAFSAVLVSAVSLYLRAGMAKEARNLHIKYLGNPNLCAWVDDEIQAWHR